MGEGRGSNYETINNDIDVIEIESELRYILNGKGYRVVHDDFLSFETQKNYDLVIMNPPFLTGDKHLLKALEVQKYGGGIVCLLNSETLKNPYTNTRKNLIKFLNEFNADIKYVKNAFKDAERKSNVEVAIVKVIIPETETYSIILDHLHQDEEYKFKNVEELNSLTENDFLKALVSQYKIEVNAGVKLVNEYVTLSPMMLKSLKKESNPSPILKLLIDKDDFYGSINAKKLGNEFVRKTRYKYWELLFYSEKFIGKFTTNLRYKFQEKLEEMSEYDFSLYNIQQIAMDMERLLNRSIEDTIINLFDDWSRSGWDKWSPNIHYYDGWKTNKAHCIGRKVIMRLDAWGWMNRFSPNYNVKEKLGDIEKTFNYLDDGNTESTDLEKVLKEAEEIGQTKKIVTKYFLVTFYKKGTCHLEFRNLNLLKKFNIFGAQYKGWLPPTYGKKSYKNMGTDERKVVDNFEGEKAYQETVKNVEYFIYTPTDGLLSLGVG